MATIAFRDGCGWVFVVRGGAGWASQRGVPRKAVRLVLCLGKRTSRQNQRQATSPVRKRGGCLCASKVDRDERGFNASVFDLALLALWKLGMTSKVEGPTEPSSRHIIRICQVLAISSPGVQCSIDQLVCRIILDHVKNEYFRLGTLFTVSYGTKNE